MTRRSLELTRTLREGKRDGSLLAVIDRTATPMGARLLADWLTSPLAIPAAIAERHDAVAEFVRDANLRSDLRSALGEAYDLERLAARVGTGRATPRDLVALARTLALLPRDQGEARGAGLEAAGRTRSGARTLPGSSRGDPGGARLKTRRWPRRKGG